MFLPLYFYFENSQWRKIIVRFSLALTLSRTVWFGLIFHELLYAVVIEKSKKNLILKLIIGLLAISLFISFISYLCNFPISFLFDSNLGGRREQLDILSSITFFSHQPFSYICEIVHLGVIKSFGIIGWLAFLLTMAAPPILYQCGAYPKTPIRSCILCGLFNYLFLSFSDGALLFIPIAAVFWFLTSLLARKQFDDLS